MIQLGTFSFSVLSSNVLSHLPTYSDETKEERRARKRKSRWGAEETDKTFIPGMPTVIPTNLSKDQEQAYLCKYRLYKIFPFTIIISFFFMLYITLIKILITKSQFLFSALKLIWLINIFSISNAGRFTIIFLSSKDLM